MAIVKLNYSRNRGKIKAALGYDAHRVSRDKEKMSRVFFGYGGVIDEDQAYRMIDNAKKGTLFFRMIISPDPKTEDTQKDLDLWQVTRQTMLCLEERLKNEVQFIAAEHNDHTDIRHIHAVVLLRGRVNPEDLQALREAATLTALSQRQARDAALSLLIQPEQSVEQSGNPRSTSFQHSIGVSGGRAQRTRSEPSARPLSFRRSCPTCGPTHSMKRMPDGSYQCFQCGLRQEQSFGLEI